MKKQWRFPIKMGLSITILVYQLQWMQSSTLQS